MHIEESTKRAKIRSMLSPDTLEKVKSLKDKQIDAFYKIMDWALLNPFGSSPAYILEGYAGTGKTFLIKVVASALPKLVLTATTNKAAKEVKRATGLPAMTIYSLLGLKMEAKEDTLVLVAMRGYSSQVMDYRFVLLDEAGMSPEVLLPYIRKAMAFGVRFLFFGDRKQVPPVGEKLSLIWDAYPTAKLTKVLRHDNQILKLVTQVRKKKLKDIEWKTDNANGEGVWCLSSDSFIRKIQKYAELGFFKNGEAKAIAWRNVTTAELNRVIRYAMFGEKIFDARYLIGDQLVFTRPYSVSKNMQCFIDDEARIEHVSEGVHPDYGFKCYFLTLQLDIGKHIIRTVHEEGQREYENLMVRFAEKARETRKKDDWFKFWSLKDSVAELTYSHALTVHRAQGSTYKYAFVKVSDILRNPRVNESKKCLYSALSRPSTRLFIN